MPVYENKEYDQELRDRIIKVMHDKMLTQKSLAKATGFQATNLSQIIRATRGVPDSLIKKMLEAYSDINPMWLIHGAGTMHRSTSDLANAECETRPRLPITAAAGALSVYLEGVMRSECEEMPVIKRFPNYDFTMFIKGNSMTPKYESGDEIALKKAVSIIEWGKDYVLATEEGAIFKKIYEEGSYIRCVSYNHDEYPDFRVPKVKIYGFYKAVGMIRT